MIFVPQTPQAAPGCAPGRGQGVAIPPGAGSLLGQPENKIRFAPEGVEA